jgi:hypothetical protein
MWAQMPNLRKWKTERMAELDSISIEETELDAEIQKTDALLKTLAEQHRSPLPVKPEAPDFNKIKTKSDADVERFKAAWARREAERARSQDDNTKEEPRS